MRSLFALIVFAAIAVAALLPAQAERRVALVIGNSDYLNTASLANPRNDAEAMSAALDRLGFEVVTGIDVDIHKMIALVRRFSKLLEGAEVGLFFYAGHGLQVDDNNYLVPVDAELGDRADLDFGTIKLASVLRQMNRHRSANLVFLDACRNNPLAKSLERGMSTSRAINIGRGLARVEAGVGTLIAYATQPGNIALDGTGRHSPFTRALLTHMETPGIDVSTMMIKVRQDVIRATGEKQVPWDHSSLTGQFYFKSPPQTPVQQVATNTETPDPTTRSSNNGNTIAAQTRLTAERRAMELSFWETVRDSNDPTLLQTYIQRFPQGLYVDLARALIARVQRKTSNQSADVTRPEPQTTRDQTTRDGNRTAALSNSASTQPAPNQPSALGKLRRRADGGDRGAALVLARRFDAQGDVDLAADYALVSLADGGRRYANHFTDDEKAWSPAFWRALQARLKADGAYRGAIDGLPGSGTRRAVQLYAGMRVAEPVTPKPKRLAPPRKTAPPPPPQRAKPPPNHWCLSDPNSSRCTRQ